MNQTLELRDEIERIIKSENIDIATKTLLDITVNSKDLDWVQNVCLSLLIDKENVDRDLRGLAITCLGHLARIHQKIDKKMVLPVLLSLKNDKDLGGRAEDALDDINQFAK